MNDDEQEKLISWLGWGILLYMVAITLAAFVLLLAFLARGQEIKRLEVLKDAYSEEAALLARKLAPVGPIDPIAWKYAPEQEKPNSEAYTVKQPIATAPAIPTAPSDAKYGTTKASWYNYPTKGGAQSRTTATTASRDFPKGTMLEVCAGDKCVELLVTDYGPRAAAHPDRRLDLSSFAFSQLAPLSRGVIKVQYREIK